MTVAFTYETSAAAVATVSESGVVTAVSPGSATITVTGTGSGAGFATTEQQATALVIVSAPPPALTALTIRPDSLELLIGANATLTPLVTTAGAGVSVQYNYISSATAVASVSESGVITALSPGSATITVTATGSGSGFTTTERQATAQLIVTAPPPAITGLSISTDSIALIPGDSTTLTPTTTAAGGGVTVDFTYSSSVSAIATVSATGVVSAVSPGSASITVTATGSGAGYSTTVLDVTVAVVVSPPPAVLGVGFADAQFALIPSGTFTMGSTNGTANERPVRNVTISQPFLMQKTEVTQGQWRQVMQGTGLENPSSFSFCGDTCPVESVSWNDVQTFLVRLNQQEPGKQFRLPTEAEWEYAARAGTTGDYGGNGVLSDMGWWFGNSGSRTRPAARKLPNAWGLFDMHGNVWEWVNDWYLNGYYAVAPNVDPPGPASGSNRVLRGGSWGSDAVFTRSADRDHDSPTLRGFGVGFRLARTP